MMVLDWDDALVILTWLIRDTKEGLERHHTWLVQSTLVLEDVIADLVDAPADVRFNYEEWSSRRAFVLAPQFQMICMALQFHTEAWRLKLKPWMNLPVSGVLLRKALDAHARR